MAVLTQVQYVLMNAYTLKLKQSRLQILIVRSQLDLTAKLTKQQTKTYLGTKITQQYRKAILLHCIEESIFIFYSEESLVQNFKLLGRKLTGSKTFL